MALLVALRLGAVERPAAKCMPTSFFSDVARSASISAGSERSMATSTLSLFESSRKRSFSACFSVTLPFTLQSRNDGFRFTSSSISSRIFIAFLRSAVGQYWLTHECERTYLSSRFISCLSVVPCNIAQPR